MKSLFRRFMSSHLNMNKIPLLIGSLVVILGGAYWLSRRGGEEKKDIEYRYEAAKNSELVRSISATGLVVADTFVDVKSLAGGNVIKLVVEEGSVVKKGDLIAVVDPADTQAVYDQASADLTTATARSEQAKQNLSLQAEQSRTEIEDAEVAVKIAQVRLDRARVEAKRQPVVTMNLIKQAQTTYEAAQATLQRLQAVTIPQLRREARGAVAESKVRLETATANLDRQRSLYDKGFVALGVVQTAEANQRAAQTAFENAVQREQTLQADFEAQMRDARLTVERANAGLQQAKANAAQNELSEIAVREAEKTLAQSKIAVDRARGNAKLLKVRESEIVATAASIVRGRVSVDNAKLQLDSTTVLAPRDGVVTKKYIEEGTIIPPGLSTFAEGTSIVQISDVTKLFVECAVDEADIANVKSGQPVRILTEAFPGEFAEGTVERVNPAATTEANITAVKVRVRIKPGYKVRILPGMNATCEFITLQKPKTLTVPSQAIKTEDGKSFVEVKTSDPLKPEKREVKVGASGNENIEILEGIKEGDQVVTAMLDLAQLRETQKKMQEAQQGGGLAGGGGGRPGGGGRGGGGGGRPR